MSLGGPALAWLLAFPLLIAGVARAETATSPRVLLIRIDGAISPAAADFIHDGIRQTKEDGADALIVEIDTPGGLLSSTKSIVQEILGAPVPVIAFVAPSGGGAASAGVFIVMAANVAAMAPGTNIGASTPIQGGGQDLTGALGEKVKSFTASFAKAIAEERGRNVEWASKAVLDAASATDREALQLGVIDVIARDIPELLDKASGREIVVQGEKRRLSLAGARVDALEMRLRQKILSILADPNVAYLLLLAGLLGLYLELSHPGGLVPGVIGALCLAISLASFQILPIDTTGLVLLVLGTLLLVAELFLPSFGIVGGVGLAAFVLGSLFLFDATEPGIEVDRGLIGGAAAAVGLVMLVVATLVVRTMRQRATTGREALIGEVAEVRTRIAPNGTVLVRGELWQARSNEPIEAGERARIVAVEGLTLQVVRAAERNG